MATVLRSPIPSILTTIRNWLLSCEVLAESLVFFTSKRIEDVPHTDGEHDIILQPGRFLPLGYEQGAGRYDTRVRRSLSVFVRSRCNSDEQSHDEIWLLGENKHFELEETVINALHLCPTEDDDGNILLVEPMRLSPSGEPRRLKGGKGWGITELEFEIVYSLALDTSGVGGEPTAAAIAASGSGSSGSAEDAVVSGWYFGFYF